MIGRILLSLVGFVLAYFVILVLIGLWDRYEQITAGLSRIYERYLAPQAGFSSDAPMRTFQQLPKLVGTDAVGSTNQGMSVALSADGNTAIVGGPGPNNADRDRPPLVGPTGGPRPRGVPGRSKARSSSAPVLWERPAKA
jgi:hypothetical protein